jgi:hypothetical protein
MVKIIVLSHYLFDEKMKSLGLNDENVESTNSAFISIIGTPECLKYYLEEEDTKHYFKDHPNVLNLDFDDCPTDVLYNGHLFNTMHLDLAEKTFAFIEEVLKNGVDTILVHCRAGMSRSRAVGEFIWRYCRDNDIDVDYDDRNDYTTMCNSGVLRILNHVYWKKYKLNEYSDGNAEYPDDLVRIPVAVINRKRNREAWRLNNRKRI